MQSCSEVPKVNPYAGKAIFKTLSAEYGGEYFRHDRYHQGNGAPEFPVRMRDEQIVSSLALSEALNQVPVVSVDYVFAERELYYKANKWLEEGRQKIIQPKREEPDDG